MQKSITFLFISLTTLTLNAQTFKSGLIAGMNLSKLNGSEKNAYNFISYKLGGRISVDVKRQLRTSIDILYSKKGNIVSHTPSPLDAYKNVSLDYMDIPLTITFMDWMDDPDEEEYYRLHFVAGVSYSRLVNFKARDNLDIDVTDSQNFNKYKLSALGGLVYYPREHLGINLEYAHSFSNLEKLDSLQAMKIRNWSLSLIYMFHNRRKRK